MQIFMFNTCSTVQKQCCLEPYSLHSLFFTCPIPNVPSKATKPRGPCTIPHPSHHHPITITIKVSARARQKLWGRVPGFQVPCQCSAHGVAPQDEILSSHHAESSRGEVAVKGLGKKGWFGLEKWLGMGGLKDRGVF